MQESTSQLTPTGGWDDDAQVSWYRARIGKLEARLAGEQILTHALPPHPRTVVDLGAGDGRVASLVLANRPTVERVVVVDRSAPMLKAARERFADDRRVSIFEGDLTEPIDYVGTADLFVSGFAIHHLEHERKRELFDEIVHHASRPGLFLNLEVVASSTPERHAEFLELIGRTHDDPEDRLAAVEDQTRWMTQAGMTNVECLWRWRGFALLAGEIR